MTLTDALAAALHEHAWSCPDPGHSSSLNGCAECRHIAAILADPAFRDALTAALGEALDAEEEVVGFTVYEAWPSAAAIVARLLPVVEVGG